MLNARARERRKTDLNFCIKARLRARLRIAMTRANTEKSYPTMTLVGCALEFLVGHIEAQFKDSMSWDNRGQWHIDHIKPCASFDLADPEQQKLCFHFSNLQPLWGPDNMSKGSKLLE